MYVTTATPATTTPAAAAAALPKHPRYSRAKSAPAHARRLPNDPIIRALGARLNFLRRRARMTQLQLSRRSGLDRSFISDMERGAKAASVVTLHTLAQTYNLTLAQLFAGVETETETETETAAQETR
jgi:DNA-binding XRE family transcriptional regulator